MTNAVNKIIKEGQTDWFCLNEITCAKESENKVMELAKTFQPLDDLLHDYERIPESAQLEPEKDPVMAGKKITIHVRDILDSKGRPSQPWQRILVKAEKGQILNGTSRADYRVFEVGDGSIDLIYKAPEECKKDSDTIFVYNTCVIDPNQQAMPELLEIAIKKFNIYCFRGRIQVDLMDYEEPEYMIIKRASVQVPFEVKPTGRPDEDLVVGHREFTEATYKVVRHSKDSLEEITGNFGVRVTGGVVGYQNKPLPFIWQPMEGYVGPYIML